MIGRQGRYGGPAARRDIAMCPELRALPQMSVEENLASGQAGACVEGGAQVTGRSGGGTLGIEGVMRKDGAPLGWTASAGGDGAGIAGA